MGPHNIVAQKSQSHGPDSELRPTQCSPHKTTPLKPKKKIKTAKSTKTHCLQTHRSHNLPRFCPFLPCQLQIQVPQTHPDYLQYHDPSHYNNPPTKTSAKHPFVGQIRPLPLDQHHPLPHPALTAHFSKCVGQCRTPGSQPPSCTRQPMRITGVTGVFFPNQPLFFITYSQC